MRSTLLLAIMLAVTLFAAAAAIAQPYGPGMMDGWGGYGWGFGLLHAAVSVAVIVAVVFLVVWAIRSLGGGQGQGYGPHHRRPAGLEVLEERYARGEINRDEYLQKKKDILD